jgi:hypothetical protein
MVVSSANAQTLRNVATLIVDVPESDLSEGQYTCPDEAPEVDSHCESGAFQSNKNVCFYNPVHVADIDEDIPSMMCTCTVSGLWQCSINPEYVIALQQDSF